MAERATPPRHDRTCASHRVYRLTCEEFDILAAAYGNKCAICGIDGSATDHGLLCIDHDSHRGNWAVRGLLCTACNTRIDAFGHRRSAREEAYLADPWFLRRFAELGLRTEPQPEPAIGSVATVHLQRWQRTGRGWERPGRLCYQARSWHRLNHDLGPHRIRIVSGQLALI